MDKSRINRVIVDEFDRLAFLTDLEKSVLVTRAAGKSQKWQEDEFCVSRPTITRTVKRLREKYNAVKGFSAILPDDLVI
uniref:FocB protein-alpha, helix-turn-helix, TRANSCRIPTION.4A n=1 Tax=Siphoviridae sp. ctqED62 TaxID=2826468 RepID=A0A8S5MRJ4_9CAUD|nr:MAG TPA: FocB protein-alpha, helix-turn-helix, TRANSCRIPTION.4A [Siphoviridae sp. ctqED62]